MLNTYIAKIQTTCCSIQGLKYLFKILLYLAVVWYMYFLLPDDFFHVKHDYHEHVNYYYSSLAKKCLMQYCVSLRISLLKNL